MTALLHDAAAFLAMCAFVAGMGIAAVVLTPQARPASQFIADQEGL